LRRTRGEAGFLTASHLHMIFTEALRVNCEGGIGMHDQSKITRSRALQMAGAVAGLAGLAGARGARAPLCNRALGPFAVTVLPIALARRAAATASS